MHWNYLKIALRNLVKQPSYAFINIIGLSTGIAAFLLIMLFVQYHLSFDKHIPDAENLYRVIQIQQAEGVGEQHVAFNPGPLAPEAVRSIPEITQAVRMINWGTVQTRVNESFFAQNNVWYTDSSAFEIFGIELLFGTTDKALDDKKNVVLSESVAKKLYGTSEDALGKTIELNYKEGFVVRAIMKDQPIESHLQIEMLLSYDWIEEQYGFLRNWGSNSMAVYVRLRPNADPAVIGEKLTQLIEENKRVEDSFLNSPIIYLQNVDEIHGNSGHIKFQMNHLPLDNNLLIAIFITALIIISIACINFINIAIARSVKRAKEVGVRKTLGASRINLVSQFIGESLIITFLALLIALILVELSLPNFNQLLNTELSLDFVSNPTFNIGLVGLWAGISLLSGFYPAFYMSRYQAVEVLKGIKDSGSKFGGLLSRALVVFQFAVAIGLVFIVLVASRQIHFVMNKDLGYNYENVIGIVIPGPDVASNAKIIKETFSQIKGVSGLAAASNINGVAGSQNTIQVDDTADTRMMTRMGYVDEDFFELMEIPIIQGRDFNHEYTTDETEAVIINQAAVEALGWDSPIGKRFHPFGYDTLPKRTVIGVISDYHYYSIHSRIEPAAFYLNREGYQIVCLKHNRNDIETFNEELEAKWQELFPGNPYQSVIVKERLEREYRSDRAGLQLFSMFTFLALLISSLGLFGLTSLRVEQRSREIAIRKVIGGNLSQMILLIISEFMKLVGVAALIAVPPAFLLSQQLISHFAYTIKITPLEPLISIFIAGFIALSTIFFQAWKVASSNPANALKTE